MSDLNRLICSDVEYLINAEGQIQNRQSDVIEQGSIKLPFYTVTPADLETVYNRDFWLRDYFYSPTALLTPSLWLPHIPTYLARFRTMLNSDHGRQN